MFAVSSRVRYGLRLLSQLSRHRASTPLPLAALASELDLPYPYLAQIARRLRAAGLLESFEGAGGGYRLAKHPAQISLADVIAALDGHRRTGGCQPRSARQCPCGGSCGLGRWWQQLDAELERTTHALTLAQLP